MIVEVPIGSSDEFFIDLRPISLNGSNSVDPTGTTSIFFAFLAPAVDPQNTDWHTGAWVEYSSVSGLATASYIMTPVTLGLSKGDGIIWAKVTGGVGLPMHPVGNYRVT